ncbi:unnamed protein product [Clonostachys solani]|uniref:Cytochrome P450 n=1 Tax=Clonostachys solani TaxID=160281 RepID=A0A9N9ZMM7_9HYPO|nr:unnamed protein product [Clonostachys solani]
MLLNVSPSVLLWAILSLVILHLVLNYFVIGVSKIPGPFPAKISNLYRLVNVSRGDNQVSLEKLHQKYGDNVRFGPRVVSIRNPKDVNQVYGIKSHYVKSPFYAVQQQMANGKPTQTLFTTLNEDFHAKIKRPIASAYSMTTLQSYEPLVNRTIQCLFEQLDRRFASTGVSCPLFDWLQFYAFDVIGQVTCSTSLGFVEQGRDIEGIMHTLGTSMDYHAVVGQVPWLDKVLKKNPVWAWFASPTGPVASFARDRLYVRLQEMKRSEGGGAAPGNGDFVDRFLQAKETHPAVVDDQQVFSYMVTNIFAGSDTTAISLRAIVYYTVKHPRVYAKLMEELIQAQAEGRLSQLATWRESQALPYFDSVVKESLRLHPAVGMILERIVPSEGLQLECGTLLPAGTIVGASPWVLHRDQSVYGEDAAIFRPERWLPYMDEHDETYSERLKSMNGNNLTFGKGHRTCIGKNISLLEIYKMLPSFFLKYDVSLVDPTAEWTLQNSWFVRQEGVEFYLRPRNQDLLNSM